MKCKGSWSIRLSADPAEPNAVVVSHAPTTLRSRITLPAITVENSGIRKSSMVGSPVAMWAAVWGKYGWINGSKRGCSKAGCVKGHVLMTSSSSCANVLCLHMLLMWCMWCAAACELPAVKKGRHISLQSSNHCRSLNFDRES